MKNLFLILGASLFVFGCPVKDDTADDSGDTMGDTDTGDIETLIDTISYSYSAASDSWTYTVELIGTSSQVILDMYQYSGGYEWDETHELDAVQTADDGSWEIWEIVLPVVYDWEEQIDNVNTLFTEEIENVEQNIDRMVTVYDPDSPTTVVDCGVWSGANGDPSHFASYGCDTFSF